MAAQDIRTNFLPGTNFSNYHTYNRDNIQGGTHPHQIVDARIKQAVDTQLAAKGMTKTTQMHDPWRQLEDEAIVDDPAGFPRRTHWRADKRVGYCQN